MTPWTDSSATNRPRSLTGEEILYAEAKHAAGVPVQAIAKMMGRRLEQVRAALPVPTPPRPEPPKPAARIGDDYQPSRMLAIAAEVAERRGLTVPELRSQGRKRVVAHARQEAMYHIYLTGKFSMPQIGAFFGGRDHSTVVHALKAHEDRTNLIPRGQHAPLPIGANMINLEGA